MAVFEAITIDKKHITGSVCRILNSAALFNVYDLNLKNESILDIGEHLELYTSLFQLAAVMSLFGGLAHLVVRPAQSNSQLVIFKLLSEFRTRLAPYCEPSILGPKTLKIYDERLQTFYENIKLYLSFIMNVQKYFGPDIPLELEPGSVQNLEDSSENVSRKSGVKNAAKTSEIQTATYIEEMKQFQLFTDSKTSKISI